MTYPIFKKERNSDADAPDFVAISGERRCTVVYWVGEQLHLFNSEDTEVPLAYFEGRYETITAEEFNTQFKRAMEALGQAVCHFGNDYIIRVDSIPTDMELVEKS